MAKRTSEFAAEQLAKKLRLEADLAPKLRRFFRDLSADLATVFAAVQRPGDLTPFQPELAAILKQHYRKVIKKFKSTTRDDILKTFSVVLELKQADNELVNERARSFVDTHADQQSALIMQTTRENLQDTLRDLTAVTVAAAIDGVTLTPTQQASLLEQSMITKTFGRVEGIATFETQVPAERTKSIEATVLAASLAVVSGKPVREQRVFKGWNSILDTVTRTSHVDADDQRVRENQPFIVQSQSLMFPGDTSLGATLDNVMQCRCAARRSVEPVSPPSTEPGPSLIDLGARRGPGVNVAPRR